MKKPKAIWCVVNLTNGVVTDVVSTRRIARIVAKQRVASRPWRIAHAAFRYVLAEGQR